MVKSLGATFSRVIFLLGACGMGAASLALGTQVYLEARASVTWPTTDGVIAESKLLIGSGRGGGEGTYKAVIKYDYTVAGAAYRGDRVWVDVPLKVPDQPVQSNQQIAEAQLAKYPLGSHVPVHYDPETPDRAVLEINPTGGLSWLLFGLAFILFGLVGSGLLWRAIRRIAGIAPR